MRELLSQCAGAHGFSLTQTQLDRFCRFGELLAQKNRVMNLTAITEPEAVALQHFIDSLYLTRAADFAGKRVIDIGCGAGFPGVPLLIAMPALELTLLDSTAKRMRWLRDELLPALDLRAECVTARAEEYVAGCRERYDLVVCRAVAQLNVLAELCLPYLRPGGILLAMKGPGAAQELEQARHAVRVLGAEPVEPYCYRLGPAQHQVVRLRKCAPTPAAYPRRFSQIRQKPL